MEPSYCDFKKKIPQNLATFSAFFSTKILCMLQWFLFLLPSGKIRPKLRTLVPSFFSVILGCIPMTGHPLFQW